MSRTNACATLGGSSIGLLGIQKNRGLWGRLRILAGKNRIADGQWSRAGNASLSPASRVWIPGPQPSPRVGLFVDPGQAGTPAQSHAGEMEPTTWTRMLSGIFTMAVAAVAVYIILFEM